MGGEKWIIEDGVAFPRWQHSDQEGFGDRQPMSSGVAREGRERGRDAQQRRHLMNNYEVQIRFVQQQDLFRRPVRRALQAASAAGERLP